MVVSLTEQIRWGRKIVANDLALRDVIALRMIGWQLGVRATLRGTAAVDRAKFTSCYFLINAR